jgi:hypothetical protein
VQLWAVGENVVALAALTACLAIVLPLLVKWWPTAGLARAAPRRARTAGLGSVAAPRARPMPAAQAHQSPPPRPHSGGRGPNLTAGRRGPGLPGAPDRGPAGGSGWQSARKQTGDRVHRVPAGARTKAERAA